MELMHLCCCCLQGAPDKDLRTTYTYLGKTEVYSDMLKQCFDLHLALDKWGSCGICSACVARLQDACDFKLQVQHCQSRLLETLCVKELPAEEADMEDGEDGAAPSVMAELKSENQMKDEDEQEYLHKDIKEEESAAASDEDPLSLSFEDAASVGTEPGLSVSDRARQQLSMACSVRLERLHSDEAPHASQTCPATSHHEPRVASQVENISIQTTTGRTETQVYTCDTCGKQFTHKSNIIKHVHEEHMLQNNQLSSLMNNSHKNTFASKKRHRRRKSFSCKYCNKQHTRTRDLVRHIRIHTGEKPFECDECNKRFACKSSLISHLKTHTHSRIKLHARVECDKRFTHNSELNNHRQLHTGEKPYECGKCNKRFPVLSYLRRHQRTHNGVKPHACVECNKRFVTNFDLVRHKRIHTGDKPFFCDYDYCNKRFRNKSYLTVHQKAHARIKQYACLECNQQFSDKMSLNEHKIHHKYTCPKCNKAFSRKHNLSVHKNIHDGVRPYKCEICERSFSRKSSIIKHITKHMK